MTTRFSVDFGEAGHVDAADRGVMYGDGFFETLRVVDGAIPLWSRHVARMHEAAVRLRLGMPDLPAIHADVLRLADGLDDAVARVTVTAGVGERGYARPASPACTIVIGVSPLALAAEPYDDGIDVRLCDTVLGDQLLLAGMKHLNRLEQVLARSEWNDARWQEGLMTDQHGDVVCATAANVFAVVAGRLVTPPVDRCGVAGVARAEVLGVRDVTIERLNPRVLAGADEVFLTSAVRGILPVRAFASRTWQPGPVTRHLQAHWRDIGLPLPKRSKDSDR